MSQQGLLIPFVETTVVLGFASFEREKYVYICIFQGIIYIYDFATLFSWLKDIAILLYICFAHMKNKTKISLPKPKILHNRLLLKI